MTQLNSLHPAHKIVTVKTTVTRPPTVIDMADDSYDGDSVVSKMTGESVGQTSAFYTHRVTESLKEFETSAVEVTVPVSDIPI